MLRGHEGVSMQRMSPPVNESSSMAPELHNGRILGDLVLKAVFGHHPVSVCDAGRQQSTHKDADYQHRLL